MRGSLRDLEPTLNQVDEEGLNEKAYMEGYLESKRRDTAGDANSARVGRETADIAHLKIEPVRIQTSPRIESNRCAQRKIPGKC